MATTFIVNFFSDFSILPDKTTKNLEKMRKMDKQQMGIKDFLFSKYHLIYKT